ncbi:unnamed protein product [Bathycoccus prasinos]
MTSKKTTVVDLIPNNYKEQPQLIEGKTRVFEEKVAAKVDDLDVFGKFLTIFQGTTVAYSELKPSYSRFLEMKSDPGILNLRCRVTNDTITYNAFTTYSYEKADACEWVKADLEKSVLNYTEDKYFIFNYVTTLREYDAISGEYIVTGYNETNEENNNLVRRDLLGNISVCKPGRYDTCKAISDDCVRGHASVEQLLSNMKIANFPLKELLDSEEKLLTFVNSTLTQSLQSLLSGLKEPRIVSKQWASKNMPVLYGYLGSMQSYVQGHVFRKSDSTSGFYKRVFMSCTVYNEVIAKDEGEKCDISRIGDGSCSENCNNVHCLYDGGDCLSWWKIHFGNSNAWDIPVDDAPEDILTYRGFSPLQAFGEGSPKNPYHDLNNAEIYTEEVKTKLKTLTNDENVLVLDTNGNGIVDDWEFVNWFHVLNNDNNMPIWQSMQNSYPGFDSDSTCGNPNTWYKSYEVAKSYIDGEDNFIVNTVLRETVYPELGYPSGASIPSGKVPTSSTEVYSCDALSQSHNLPGIVGTTAAEIKVWVDYLYAVLEYFKEKCGAGTNPGEWQTECWNIGNLTGPYGDLTSSMKNVQFPAILLHSFEASHLLGSLEFAYFGASARENSGSVEQLLLDAGIKRDAKGYNVEANVDYEAYYTASGISECTYSKKVGASPATVVAVVLGLIGGVTTLVSVFALVLYQLFRTRVFKKYKKLLDGVDDAQQSKNASSSVPV